MREIKFRAWDGVRFDYFPTIWNGMVWNPFEDREIHGCILQQYTGLKDKNGKEIYEGDVLISPFTGSPVAIVYDQQFCQFTFGGAEFGVEVNALDEEIIGNIYENPELMNGSTI